MEGVRVSSVEPSSFQRWKILRQTLHRQLHQQQTALVRSLLQRPIGAALPHPDEQL